MIVCGNDYSGNDIVAINPVAAATFSSCIDYCMYQGTACVGVSWVERDTDCFLKKKMAPSGWADTPIYSAIRITGPASGPASTSLISNGDFAVDLSPWTTSQQTQKGNSFVWDDGKA
jgi:hypothetical protein